MTSRYQAKPGEIHWVAVKSILKYMRRTKDLFLVFRGDTELSVKGYIDSSFQTDRDDLKSQAGFVFMINGSAFSWRSFKEPVVADSTMELEYIAASEAAKEVVWIRQLLEGLRVVPSAKHLITLYCDNREAIFQGNEPKSSNKSRHVPRKFHMIRDYIERKEIEICKVGTDHNIPDPLTKTLPLATHDRHVVFMGLKRMPNLY
ncbi:secreted RxLR effector protein 161-like [Silene latifolia]|uniref:secreted RxLR effector protein 161-like n=1 Tax=Silene latifolia TaxID=37657 RepID=UPI003D77A8F9